MPLSYIWDCLWENGNFLSPVFFTHDDTAIGNLLKVHCDIPRWP